MVLFLVISQQEDILMNRVKKDIHDPKGKVRLKLLPEVKGSASFSKDRKYRYVLKRTWGDGKSILWIGMNPSTADADVDDPTVRREIVFSKLWGYEKYIKCNVLDYRATNPRMLIDDTKSPCSKKNFSYILREASKVDKIVLAYGVLPKSLQVCADEIINSLTEKDYSLYVLGFTKDGHPRHPLYMKKTSTLKKYTAREK